MDESLLVLGAVALVAIALAVEQYLEKRRSRALSQAASEIGFSFHPGVLPVELELELQDLPLFKQGHGGGAKNVLQGNRHGNDVLLFDYAFTVGRGEDRHDYHQTVAAFRTCDGPLPCFELRPDGIKHKIGSVFGLYKDIDFEANPEFSSHYLLRGSDERAVRASFHPRVLGFFKEERGWAVEGGGSWLVVYRPAKRIKLDELRSFLEASERIFRLFSRN